MTEKQKRESINKMKLQLTKSELVKHWGNFIFMLLPVSLFSFTITNEQIQNNQFPYFMIIYVVTVILLLIHKINAPKLKKYTIKLNTIQFKEANQAICIKKRWRKVSNRSYFFSAIESNLSQSSGIKITAFHKDDSIYINSMINPGLRSNPFYFKNKKNRAALLQQYKKAAKGENVIEVAVDEHRKFEEKLWNESNWTFKKTIMRITGYGFSILFFVIAFLLFSSKEISGIFSGLFLIALAITYIYFDIDLIIKKKKRSKKNQ